MRQRLLAERLDTGHQGALEGGGAARTDGSALQPANVRHLARSQPESMAQGSCTDCALLGRADARSQSAAGARAIGPCTALRLAGCMQLPRRIYFGREVARTDRGWLDTYSLKKRAYLGPTSMDTEMAWCARRCMHAWGRRLRVL